MTSTVTDQDILWAEYVDLLNKTRKAARTWIQVELEQWIGTEEFKTRFEENRSNLLWGRGFTRKGAKQTRGLSPGLALEGAIEEEVRRFRTHLTYATNKFGYGDLVDILGNTNLEEALSGIFRSTLGLSEVKHPENE